MSWADDPELLATFRTEVEERLASLSEGLVLLEHDSSPRARITSLFRDAHTVKGSARMLGLDTVVTVAHRAEDLFGALRDGRLTVRRDLIDLLLATTEGIRRALPGAEHHVTAEELAPLVEALDRAIAGDDPIEVPKFATTLEVDDDDTELDLGRGRNTDGVRVPARRLYDLLDRVGEAELELRRIERRSVALNQGVAAQLDRIAILRDAAKRVELPPAVADAVHGLVAGEDQMGAACRDLRSGVDEARARMVQVRDGAMGLAMVPVRRVAAGFPQLVREVAGATGKDVRLVVTGEDVELDTRVLNGVAEALRHLVTNAVDHGCDTTAERLAAGKPAQAVVSVAARSAGATVVMEVADDGYGIDEANLCARAVAAGMLSEEQAATPGAVLPLLFLPGFSSRSDVTETSGRGIGLDVVRTAVEELGGTVEIDTELGAGTRFVITLPVTLGVMRCLVARVGDERYAVPVTSIVETLTLSQGDVQTVAGAPVLGRESGTVPLADLGSALGVTGERDARVAVVVRLGGTNDLFAYAVDALEGESEMVVKEMGSFLARPHGISGATIDSDGTVMLLLDIRELAVAQISSNVRAEVAVAQGRSRVRGHHDESDVPRQPRVLVVEDSAGVRELERVILEGAGYDVTTAVDGLDGASRLADAPVDLVVSDVEMPGMDGFTLTRTIRRTRGWEDVPVVIMTSRGDEADQRAGLDAGANAYLLKTEFDQNDLIETVRRLVGR